MKTQATYACGHDAARFFDGRNMGQRCEAASWPERASRRMCPDCNTARRVAQVQAMDEATLRRVLTAMVDARGFDDAVLGGTF